MTLQEIVKRFNTTPFLFAGSGITRRYYNLPDWKSLLTYFAELTKKDQFAFQSYDSRVEKGASQNERYPRIASLIEQDFNQAWFNNEHGIRSDDNRVANEVLKGTSPFKAEIAHYIRTKTMIDDRYSGEIEKLKKISTKNISGIITTNYDCFFESLFGDYRTFVGQDELIFSQLQGIAEIYKIHGSIELPSSIIINHNDYDEFQKKSKYLAAKLMTIFMEYPIIFVGYSISDMDIQEILGNIVMCLPAEKISVLQKRFVFVEYNSSLTSADISSHSMTINGRVLEMTKVALSDFGLIYDALKEKKAALPVKVLRRFKDELYTFAITATPGPTLQVASLSDKRIDENMLALTIGLAETGRFGLGRAVNAEQWYRNIVINDLPYDIDEMLEFSYPDLARQNSWKLPVWYYIRNAKKAHPEIEQKAFMSYSDIVTESQIQRNRGAVKGRSATQIWKEERDHYSRAIRLLGNLPETSISSDALKTILEEIFTENPDALISAASNDRSSLHRLIRIYDYLNYGKKESP